MTPERWQQVKTILEQALDREPGERAAFLATVCTDDRELCAEVESLLAVEADSEDFIETPLLRLRPSEPPLEPLAIGERVGAYRIVREVGRGGMGSVYLATRADEAFEKQVAIKVVRRGMDTEEVVRRFRSERQILAKLDHPNIAKLLDAGATADGRPYFVLEHVEGRPIDEYCEAEGLPLRKRIELVLAVCSAVQLAHQNLVVHRDLKPGNILVTADGTPKLLDFGIAKLLDPASPEAGMTQLGLRPMTPEYASPEQMNGEPVTTASDVYSLGVLLYVLLTGRSPYRPPPTDREGLARAVREETPPKPSSVVVRPGEGGRRLQGDPQVVRKGLAGDLDNIILKAMRKEPERRYASVEGLAGDLRRYLEGLPVSASGDTWRYRAGKFVRRHRLAVTLTAAVALLLVGSSIAMTLLWQRAVRERDRAETVTRFLVDVFENPDPSQSRGEDVSAREVLDSGAKKIETELQDQPELKADFMETMGRVYRNLGQFETARKLLEESLALRRATLGEDDLQVANGLQNLGLVRRDLGEMKEAEDCFRESIEIQQRRNADETFEYAINLGNLGSLLENRGDVDEAERLLRQSLKLKQRVGADQEDIATSFNNLGAVLHKKGDLPGAEAHYRKALEMRRTLLGANHPETTSSMNNLAVVLEDQGDLASAEPLYREVVAIRRSLYRGPHIKVAGSLSNLAALLVAKGDGRAAEQRYREALEMAEKLQIPSGHATRAVFLKGLAASLVAQGHSAEAEPFARRAVEILRNADEPVWLADAESVLGSCLAAQGRFAEAEPLLVRAYRTLRAEAGEGARYVPAALDRVIGLYTAWRKPKQAETYKALRKKEKGAPRS